MSPMELLIGMMRVIGKRRVNYNWLGRGGSTLIREATLFRTSCQPIDVTVRLRQLHSPLRRLTAELLCYLQLLQRSYLVCRYFDQGFQAFGSWHVQDSGRHSGRGGRGQQRPPQAPRRLSFWQAQEVGSYPNLHISRPGERCNTIWARCYSKSANAGLTAKFWNSSTNSTLL